MNYSRKRSREPLAGSRELCTSKNLANICMYKSKVKPPTKFTNKKYMSATSGNKRAREGTVKQEDQAPDQQLQQVEPQQPKAFDLKKTRERGDHIKWTISEFSQVFTISGVHIPIVLHFRISDWTAVFKAQLLRHGLDELSCKQHINATLGLCLATWSKTVAGTDVCLTLNITQRWIVERYVNEGVLLGYFDEKQMTMEKILRDSASLPPPA